MTADDPHANFFPNTFAASDNFTPKRSSPSTEVIAFLRCLVAKLMTISFSRFFFGFPFVGLSTTVLFPYIMIVNFWHSAI